jgi:hypothetical protein
MTYIYRHIVFRYHLNIKPHPQEIKLVRISIEIQHT